MSERTRSGRENASADTGHDAPPDGARCWTPEGIAEEDARIKRVLDACFGAPDAPFAQRVAALLLTCKPHECVMVMEEDELTMPDGVTAVGFRVALCTKTAVADLVDARYGKNQEGIIADIRGPGDSPAHRAIVMRFYSGAICVFSARVGFMGKGGQA